MLLLQPALFRLRERHQLLDTLCRYVTEKGRACVGGSSKFFPMGWRNSRPKGKKAGGRARLSCIVRCQRS
jgi:hypothetical protein